MPGKNHPKFHLWFGVLLLAISAMLACSPGFFAPPTPTATPTKTPKAQSAAQAAPTQAPVETVAAPDNTPIPTDTPLPTNTPSPTETPIPADTATPLPPADTPAPTNTPVPANTATSAPPTNTPEPSATPTPEVAYRISHYKVLGENENNGGIFNKGGQHFIFLSVVDANGVGIDGALVKDANGSSFEVVTGSKGPGKAEISMEWEPYKLYVAADPNGPATSETSNQMNTAFPHIPDIVGKLGSIDNEYSVCPTPDIRCEPPFYSVHFSYEITFQRTY
ncbi:MAG TPA: hypothetical protein G4N96_10990 [Chloroflexi bacterium]|nr:MAG: hypothetical protein B6243_05110 [Anaerolineaceae bacterium 4572_5.2]HEY85620.1 hypothetical protein [Chloroflexota bacterium]